jgi:hypothetical protein
MRTPRGSVTTIAGPAAAGAGSGVAAGVDGPDAPGPSGFACTVPSGVLSGAATAAVAGGFNFSSWPMRIADGLSIPFQIASSR